MKMPTDNERREVARRLREYVDLPDDWWQETRSEFYVEKCVFDNVYRHSEAELFARLADLIEPTSDPTGRGIDSVYDWCREGLEGADGAEDELFCSIMRAIEDYRHPERATAHTVRAVDRDALLALASSMSVRRSWLSAVDAERGKAIARRIREALGVGQ